MIAGIMAVAALAGPSTSALAEEVHDLSTPKPEWLTPDLEAKIKASGTEGYDVKFARAGSEENAALQPDCLGTAPPYAGTAGVDIKAVSAATCMVSPHGCSMNFIFNDGVSNYIGTAGHCVAGGRTVIAQIATRVDPTDSVVVTLAAIGSVVKSWNAGIGRDFALVKINPGFKVMPGVSGAFGPTGVFCGDPVGQPVMHFGHGYIFLVGQGTMKFGEVIPDLSAVIKFTDPGGFNWVGYGVPGDSGSEVMNDAGLAVGDLTHGLGVAGLPVPGLSFGMDMKTIFSLIGNSYKLVTVDGRRVGCAGGLVGI
jgi:hypothetical protein